MREELRSKEREWRSAEAQARSSMEAQAQSLSARLEALGSELESTKSARAAQQAELDVRVSLAACWCGDVRVRVIVVCVRLCCSRVCLT